MTRENPLICVAEMLHASLKGPAEAMTALRDKGTDTAYSEPSEELDYLKNLIASEADDGADFIDICVDPLATETDKLIKHYVRLVHENGKGVPACIDSSNVDVLVAGLKEWFAQEGAKPPLLNSISYNEREKYQAVLDLRADNPFNAVCMLSGPEGTLKSVDAIHEAARDMASVARDAGFSNDEVFFDCMTLGMAADGCMSPTGEIQASHTHNCFHAIQKIKSDPELEGCKTILGVSNWAYGTKARRIGHIRAYIAVAMEYGLDAGIVDVSKQYGIKPASPELMDFVRTFVSLDGSEDSMMTYAAAMQEARENGWI